MQLWKDKNGEMVDPTEYWQIVGSLRYLLHTRPNLTYSVGMVSRYMERLTIMHKKVVKQILRYLKGTMEFGLEYVNEGEGKIVGFNNSSLEGDVDDQ